MNTQKSLPIVVAVGLHLLFSLGAIVFTLPPILSGADPEGPPMFIIVVTLIIGLLGLVSAWGLWQGQRWGMISTIALRVLDSLGSAPGIVFAPTLALQVLSGVSIALSIVVIVLLLMPASRRVFA
ncbi:MAG: hypothetical protein KDF65_15645 [Anaerolineae bacterium]|nr:hypothetical protein [Anaerolineae bacterium]